MLELEFSVLEGIGATTIFATICSAGYFVYERIAYAIMEICERKSDPFDNGG